MDHPPPFIVRLVTAAARPLGLDDSKLQPGELTSPERHKSSSVWSTAAQLLHALSNSVGGASGMEAVGANLCLGFRPYRQLADLYFGLEDLYQVTVGQVVPHWFGSQLQTAFRRQPDNTFRITLSLDREQEACFPFWALMLGHLRSIPQHLHLPFAAVDVEFGDRFGEYIIVPPAGTEELHGPASSVRKTVRERLLDDLLLCADADQSVTSLPAEVQLVTKIPSPDNAPISIGNSASLDQLLKRIQRELRVSSVRLSAYLPDGLWPLGAVGEPSSHARLRRTFWVQAQPIACIDAEREGSGDPSAINAELDERTPDYVQSIVELLGTTSSSDSPKFSPDKAAVINEPFIAEPPPSSRGRFRAARNSRVDEMAKLWGLTPRQASVMALLVEGLANKEIAMRLGCSVGTIENHVTCILKRARAASRAALTAAFWDRASR
jgi:DNA-binding CsgD family transcriptional regulator